MLYPSRDMVADAIRAVPRGSTSSVAAIRAELAQNHGAESTCPVTTQRLVAELAEAAVNGWPAAGGAVPVWRVIDPDRPSARNLVGGPDFIRARQHEERQ